MLYHCAVPSSESRKKLLVNADIWPLVTLRAADTFGFDYNEMALSSFSPDKFRQKTAEQVWHNENVNCASFALPLILLLCCSSSIMKHKQKCFVLCFLFGRKFKAAVHTVLTIVYIWLRFRTYWKVSFDFLPLHCVSLSLHLNMN